MALQVTTSRCHMKRFNGASENLIVLLTTENCIICESGKINEKDQRLDAKLAGEKEVMKMNSFLILKRREKTFVEI